MLWHGRGGKRHGCITCRECGEQGAARPGVRMSPSPRRPLPAPPHLASPRVRPPFTRPRAPQFLESYKSVTLGAMAAAFGGSPAFLDAELVGAACRLPPLRACLHAHGLPAAAFRACGPGGGCRGGMEAGPPRSCPSAACPPPAPTRPQADFIVAGRLAAKIDKVAGVVETNR